ncbi:MAG: hypothetical protein BGO69_00635 [Bacteroidetes bacterium 46-16]|nr:MAG: hypothetical protein BGO69_00635 [Bacteroidetes bacterium 46-16]
MWTINVLCWWLSFGDKGENIIALLSLLILFKLFCYLPVWYIVKNIRAQKLYYYYNLHISNAALWLIPFLGDLLIFIVGLWLSRNL